MFILCLPQAPEMMSRPNFEVDIIKANGRTLSFTCAYVHPDMQEGGGETEGSLLRKSAKNVTIKFRSGSTFKKALVWIHFGNRIRIHFFQMWIRRSGSTITERWIRGSGSIFSNCGSQDPDPDPRKNEMDPKRCSEAFGQDLIKRPTRVDNELFCYLHVVSFQNLSYACNLPA